jgi:hypothetical protein
MVDTGKLDQSFSRIFLNRKVLCPPTKLRCGGRTVSLSVLLRKKRTPHSAPRTSFPSTFFTKSPHRCFFIYKKILYFKRIFLKIFSNLYFIHSFISTTLWFFFHFFHKIISYSCLQLSIHIINLSREKDHTIIRQNWILKQIFYSCSI